MEKKDYNNELKLLEQYLHYCIDEREFQRIRGYGIPIMTYQEYKMEIQFMMGSLFAPRDYRKIPSYWDFTPHTHTKFKFWG
jgi:hypothetical protein